MVFKNRKEQKVRENERSGVQGERVGEGNEVEPLGRTSREFEHPNS